ncbi:hypothetical protein EJ06DRAFT_522322 [Trichodelitschia bisporula]|uniref:CFEM domain-containing protein n=1 Tax=Trichodelitschia bisporula TaxID=703511 RepID=A0A6G1HTX6_9PEZI|nr:hypothetical protein EJ06DRAFT_522322 [Trichodelitschia bisporula]
MHPSILLFAAALPPLSHAAATSNCYWTSRIQEWTPDCMRGCQEKAYREPGCKYEDFMCQCKRQNKMMDLMHVCMEDMKEHPCSKVEIRGWIDLVVPLCAQMAGTHDACTYDIDRRAVNIDRRPTNINRRASNTSSSSGDGAWGARITPSSTGTVAVVTSPSRPGNGGVTVGLGYDLNATVIIPEVTPGVNENVLIPPIDIKKSMMNTAKKKAGKAFPHSRQQEAECA